MQSVRINEDKCLEVSKVLGELEINSGFLSRPFLRKDLDPEIRLRMLFFSVAICHQTHSLKSMALDLSGWEFMEEVFLKIAQISDEFLSADQVTGMDPERVGRFLLKSFSDDGTSHNSTLDRIEERTNLYLNTAEVLHKRYDGSLSRLFDQSGNFLLRDGDGLYELLDDFTAYSDPLRKKSAFFLKLASDSELFTPRDPENIIPIMDYHMQRVLLRTGCVEIKDLDFAERLRKRVPVESDIEIREACIDALRLIARNSGHSVFSMNDIFWPLGRSCCHETCLCQTGSCKKHPCTLTKTLKLDNHSQCIFDASCKGKTDPRIRSLWQPMIETHYY
jgi:hypothetical protein